MTQDAGAQVATEAPKNDFVTTERAPRVKAADEAPTKAPEPKVDEAAEGPENTDSSEGKKPKTGWQRKIARLERELAAERAAKAQPQTNAPEPVKVIQAEPPKPENFQTYDEFVKASIRHEAKIIADETLTERDKRTKTEAEQRKASDDLQAKGAKYEQAKEEIRAVHADFDEKIDAYDGPQNPQILMALLDSDKPAEVAYYLANNLDEAEKMDGMTVLQLNRFMAKIEAKLENAPKETPKEPETQAPKAAVKTTKAPPPVSPVKGAAKSDTGPPEEYDDYRTWRKRNP